MSRTAVVLFNLGGPDSREAVRPFLFNFFMDKNIIRAPLPVRWFVAMLISLRRSRKEANSSYAMLGYKSPLLENTQVQAQALQDNLGDNFRVFVSMRYWHPMADVTARQVKDYAPDRIILLPLYPQYSTTTTRSSFQSWDKAAAACGLDVPTSRICCYPFEPGFIAASADLIRGAYEEALEETAEARLPLPRILFSAHGLPEDVIKDGDSYQWQCERCAEEIIKKVDIPALDWQVCYQSRVGPKKWIGPSTEEALMKTAEDGVPVVIYPHAFVNEHVETLVEIELEYRHLADELGIPYFDRVPTVDDHPAFIRGLAALVLEAATSGKKNLPQDAICPATFKRCGRRCAV